LGKTKSRVRKAIKKLAVDLLKLYAAITANRVCLPEGYALAGGTRGLLPYQATTDQLKAVQDVKSEIWSDRPMDRLVCGDVGFGKTE